MKEKEETNEITSETPEVVTPKPRKPRTIKPTKDVEPAIEIPTTEENQEVVITEETIFLIDEEPKKDKKKKKKNMRNSKKWRMPN